MVKFCLQCKNAFWGGQYCPKCPGEIELLDAALPENKKVTTFPFHVFLIDMKFISKLLEIFIGSLSFSDPHLHKIDI